MIGNPYKGANFKGLIRYLYEGRKGEENPHRVIWSEVRNLPMNEPMVVAGMMRATTSLSRGTKKPVYHLPVSWPPEEQPTKEVQMQVAEQLIADLGLSEHQSLIVAHDDGDCPHIHIVVNTVHPETGRVWNAWRDVYRIMESLQRQEQELGLRIVDRPDLDEHRAGKKNPDRQKDPSRGEKLRAEREGNTPLAKWSETEMRRIRADITAHFKEATSWEELEARLEAHGLELRPAGQGFRITDGAHFMTLSKVGKHARQDRLEARFQETWDEYDINRNIDRELSDQLEPPDAERPESILEELAQEAERQKAKQKADTQSRVKRAFALTEKYAYFRSKEKEAADDGEKLIRDRRALRQNQFIAERIANDITEASGQMEDIFSQLYRNPKTARAAFDRRIQAGEQLEEIDLAEIGKKRGWRLLGFRSKARKDANAALAELPRIHRRLASLANQKERHDHEGLTLQAKIGASEDAYARVVEVVGDRDTRNARRLSLWGDMRDAMREITDAHIREADLPEEHRDYLHDAWRQVQESERKGDRTRTKGQMQRDMDDRDER